MCSRVNSKATLKVPLDALLSHVPAALHHEVRASRYVAERSSAFIIQADDSRKQTDNAHSCYKRLYEAIVAAGQAAIPGETSAEQAKRVKDLYVRSIGSKGPTDKLAAKSLITSAGSRARSSIAPKRAREVVAVTTESKLHTPPLARVRVARTVAHSNVARTIFVGVWTVVR